jgi:hypothetical protein
VSFQLVGFLHQIRTLNYGENYLSADKSNHCQKYYGSLQEFYDGRLGRCYNWTHAGDPSRYGNLVYRFQLLVCLSLSWN